MTFILTMLQEIAK